MITCRFDIVRADREELVEHLEGARGMQCYDHETTEELREAALEDWPTYCEEIGLEEPV